MRRKREEELWPRPQFYSIYCPVCRRPAARLEYDPPVARYLYYGRTGIYWHGVILKEKGKCDATVDV